MKLTKSLNDFSLHQQAVILDQALFSLCIVNLNVETLIEKRSGFCYCLWLYIALVYNLSCCIPSTAWTTDRSFTVGFCRARLNWPSSLKPNRNFRMPCVHLHVLLCAIYSVTLRASVSMHKLEHLCEMYVKLLIRNSLLRGSNTSYFVRD